jgi:hypothetical protein
MIDDFASLNESLEAGQEALKLQKEYPELADLDHRVVTDLAHQNFRCSACGESALRNRESYRILKFKNMDCSPDGFEYTIRFERFWEEECLEGPYGYELIKTVKI